MSYEGYEQALCSNGHYESWDCYSDPMTTCRAITKDGPCGASFVWFNSVDETNGCDQTHPLCCGEVKLKEMSSTEYHPCPICNNVHIIDTARYSIVEAKREQLEIETRRDMMFHDMFEN